MFRLGPTELTMILLIVVLLFGAGCIGPGIRAFRDGFQGEGRDDN